MKTLPFLFILIILSSFQGCRKNQEESGKSVLVKLEIKNASSRKVFISLFDRNNTLFKNVEISSLDSMIVEEGFLHPAPAGPNYSLTNSLDSAIIEFSDGKKLIQTARSRGNNDNINNVLIDIFYKNFESLKPEFVRKQFTITESDYLRAK